MDADKLTTHSGNTHGLNAQADNQSLVQLINIEKKGGKANNNRRGNKATHKEKPCKIKQETE